VRQLSGGNVVGLCGEDSPQRDDAQGVQASVSTAFTWIWFACAQHACHHPAVLNPMNRPMKLRYSIPALALALALAACAAQPSVQTNTTDIVCDKETPIDSPAPVSMCNEREE